MTSLIDFASIGPDIVGLLGAPATAAIAIGGVILAARIGWKLFKGFTR